MKAHANSLPSKPDVSPGLKIFHAFASPHWHGPLEGTRRTCQNSKVWMYLYLFSFASIFLSISPWQSVYDNIHILLNYHFFLVHFPPSFNYMHTIVLYCFVFFLSQFDSCDYLFCLLGWTETTACTEASMTSFLTGLSDKISEVNGGSECPSTTECVATCNVMNYSAGNVTYKCPSSGKGDPELVGDDCAPLRNHLFLIFL